MLTNVLVLFFLFNMSHASLDQFFYFLMLEFFHFKGKAFLFLIAFSLGINQIFIPLNSMQVVGWDYTGVLIMDTLCFFCIQFSL